MKLAKVFNNNILCGYLTENDDGYVFEYIDEYLENINSKPVSLTLPLRKEKYYSNVLFPFFDGLIPEGWYLYLTIKIFNLDPRNRFDILLKTGKNTIGSVSIEENDLDE